MFKKIKEWIKKRILILGFVVLCVIVCVAYVSCADIGDGSHVQFGLVNDNISEGSINQEVR